VADSPPESDPRLLGAAAERRVERWLRLRGWRICARNWIGGGGELDLVASRWRTLLIVEVRRRGSDAAAAASVDQAKIERTLRAARALVRAHALFRYRLRLDMFTVDADGRIGRREDVVRQTQAAPSRSSGAAAAP
jgi:Holliday junction resolvase-like predicted endonuclease